jgi:tRNA(fMet)-specific endonuclease VapC
MDSILIDTDVLSFLFKQDSRTEIYKSHLEGKLGIISFMTVAELEFWANVRNWGAKRRSALSAFLDPYTIIHSDPELVYMWAMIRSEVMRSGQHIDTADCWIAATARLHAIPLLTHNRNHFSHVNGLITISERQ